MSFSKRPWLSITRKKVKAHYSFLSCRLSLLGLCQYDQSVSSQMNYCVKLKCGKVQVLERPAHDTQKGK